jgi:PAS domain-containing protein
MTCNVDRRFQQWRQYNTKATEYTPVVELVGQYAHDWVDIYERSLMEAIKQVFADVPDSFFGNERLHGGEGKGRERKWTQYIYLLEQRVKRPSLEGSTTVGCGSSASEAAASGSASAAPAAAASYAVAAAAPSHDSDHDDDFAKVQPKPAGQKAAQ